MSRELLLMRHGKSDRSSGGGDFERPLNDRGKRAAQRIGVWLWRQGLRPDLIVSSPAERALTTAHKCCKSMGMDAQQVIEEQRLYLASVPDLLDLLATLDRAARRVMLVGHNPGLAALLERLADSPLERPANGKLLPTGALAHLKLADDWHNLPAACARVYNVVRPRTLPAGFPFPAPDGAETRPRPAYYYSQSAVIPYRIDADGRAQFLVIGSSKKHHWVVPKGIRDPGLSARASAAREAWEEAGIRGQVSEQPLGSYRVAKWGAQCDVEVYAMQVTEVVAEADWEERHRRRRWLHAAEAAGSLKQPELGALLREFADGLEA